MCKKTLLGKNYLLLKRKITKTHLKTKKKDLFEQNFPQYMKYNVLSCLKFTDQSKLLMRQGNPHIFFHFFNLSLILWLPLWQNRYRNIWKYIWTSHHQNLRKIYLLNNSQTVKNHIFVSLTKLLSSSVFIFKRNKNKYLIGYTAVK